MPNNQQVRCEKTNAVRAVLTMRIKQFLLLCAFYQCVIASATTEKSEKFDADYINENLETPRKLINDLILQQTDAIKKIVLEQQIPLGTQVKYPTNTKHDADIKYSNNNDVSKTKGTIETESIYELKKQCQHLSRIFDSVISMQPQKLDSTLERTKTVEAIGAYNQPDLLKFKPKFSSPPPMYMPQPQQMPGNYFIFTQTPEMYVPRINKYSDKMDEAASNTEEDVIAPSDEIEYEDEEDSFTTTTTQSPELPDSDPTMSSISSTSSTTTEPIPIMPIFKYVPLEPIVQKKVLLPSGKNSIYWYRLLPKTQSFVQIPDTPETENVKVVAQPQSFNEGTSLPAQYHFYIDPQTGVIKANTAAKQTVQPQFFINPQTGMIYQSALPHQFIYHKRVTSHQQYSRTTTTEKNMLPTYTIDIPQPEEEHVEFKKSNKHEFRFVIPMAVSGTRAQVSNYPYQFDPLAYLPKDQRPATMNIPVPYVPNYQMIRTLSIPSEIPKLAAERGS
ncbi:uncharacterized protein [Atheta coriaria]|uniref:uncharacterized protein n=1 Tax=Dalotia coriaria TaxID=877792 RepID=UPI0031F43992